MASSYSFFTKGGVEVAEAEDFESKNPSCIRMQCSLLEKGEFKIVAESSISMLYSLYVKLATTAENR